MAMKAVIFNVEHGACAFLRTPSNHALLIDCGCTEKFSPVLYIAQNELPTVTVWNFLYRLTKLIVTHPHDDHIEDIETLTKKCPPGILLRQRYDWEEVKTEEGGDYDNLDTYTDWQDKYNEPVTEPDYGMTIESFYLTPEDAKKVDEHKYLNNSSIATVATVQGSKYTEKFLFGGDMETAGWEALLKNNFQFKAAVKGVDFYIASHHGHESGFSQALYDAMGKPILNLVSIHHNDEHIDGRYSQEA